MKREMVLLFNISLGLVGLPGCQSTQPPIPITVGTPGAVAAGGPATPAPVNAPVPAGFQLVTDPKDVEAMAIAIQPGAVPPKGYQGFVGFRGAEAMAVALAPTGWVTNNPPVHPNSPDVAIYMLSMSARQARYREELENALRDQVGVRTGMGATRTVAMQAIVLKVGSVDIPAHELRADSRFGNSAKEYEVTYPYKGQTIRIVVSGLPGFGGFFPLPLLADFLKKLPSPPPIGPGGKFTEQ